MWRETMRFDTLLDVPWLKIIWSAITEFWKEDDKTDFLKQVYSRFLQRRAFGICLTQLTIINYSVVPYLEDILDTFVNNIPFAFIHFS